MFKKLLLLLFLLLLIHCFEGARALAANTPQIKAASAILMDAKTGQVLYEKNSHNRRAPASTTKVLTALLAIESGRLDEMATISISAASTPGSTMGLYVGQHISLRELLTGLLLRSGNDAAVAIAQHLEGSVKNFADLMNQKAYDIGARESHFVNPHGLTKPDHYTTAYDLALITRYAMQNPTFAELVNTKETEIDWLNRKGHEEERSLRNTNKLLWMFEEADGVKTGTTGAAGPCLVSSATRDNQKLIAVVLHDRTRWADSMQLLNYGFNTFDLMEYAAANEIVTTIGVENGMEEQLDGLAETCAAAIVPAEQSSAVTITCDVPTIIKAPVYQGQKIGEIIFYVNNQAIKTIDIIAAKDIREKTLEQLLFDQLLNTYRQFSHWGVL
jgi:serine-type D-Ala-D-Ala carboxypeptidase (penicillin-binding protein 5/6)